jgi:hypothetical protein
MNKRIEELMLEAGFTERVTETPDGRELHEPVFNAEKFAELIVRECGRSCTIQGDEDDMFRKFGIKHF